MAITYTARGTASSKTSGTTLALSSVSITAGNVLVVSVVYDAGQGAPVVTWGDRTLRQSKTKTSGTGVVTAIFVLWRINNTNTRTVTCTWAGAITAKAMTICEVSGGGSYLLDVSDSDANAATGAPDTEEITAPTTTYDDTISIAAFGSEGPNTDTVGTAGDGHTLGQRIGTVGAPPASNVTLQETYEILTATGTCKGSLSGATARDWANCIIAIAGIKWEASLSPTDFQLAEAKFESLGYDFSGAVFKINEELGRMEVYQDTDLNTVVAHSANNWA